MFDATHINLEDWTFLKELGIFTFFINSYKYILKLIFFFKNYISGSGQFGQVYLVSNS